MKKVFLPVIITALVTTLLTTWVVNKFEDQHSTFTYGQQMPVHYASLSTEPATQPVDFSPAAESAVKCVVHVMTLTQGKTVIAQNPFDPFGLSRRAYQIPDQMGSGSGVLISPDGYIVTNNHVVKGADKVQVTFNNRNTQIAKVVGTDPATDLAVLKIEGDHFPYMTLGNSDDVKLGQWVLAVGYPLNLDATVTAGIVSGKGRSIGINQRNSPDAIESFIQTDAAVNPGNSGGPLVNTDGQLIGINSAIASPTGSYAGYAYAIPSNIVQKVANDIIKYGSVRRGFLGVSLLNLNKISQDAAAQFGISEKEYRNATGVFINKVFPGSAAAEAGLKRGDYITSVNQTIIRSTPQLVGEIASFHPGDKVDIGYRRDGKDHTATVVLKNNSDEDQLAKTADQSSSATLLGAGMRDLTASEASSLNISGGVMVTAINSGILAERTNIRPGFVIFSANNATIKNLQDLKEVIAQTNGQLQLAGVYPGQDGVYYYGFSKD